MSHDSSDKNNPQHARELKVHTAGVSGSLVQLTFCQKNNGRARMRRSTAIDRYDSARQPSFVREV